MIRRFNVVALGLTLAMNTVTPAAQSPTLKTVMHEKLLNAQKLLEAVIAADYRAVDRYGEALSHITYTEIASWQVNAEPEYLRHANSFLASVKGIRKAADNADLAGVTSEYTTLITSCTQCHAYVHKRGFL